MRKRNRTAYMRGYRAQVAASRADGGLLPFQARFVQAVSRKEHPVDIAALSVLEELGHSFFTLSLGVGGFPEGASMGD